MEKKIEHAFYDLLSKKLSGDATQVELEELHTILDQNPSLKFLYDGVMKPAQGQEDVSGHTQQAWALHFAKLIYATTGIQAQQQELKKKPATRVTKKVTYVLLAAACIIALLIGGNLLFTHYQNNDKPLVNNWYEMVTPKASKSNLALPDGTKVTLNADSKISYGDGFGKGIREVLLDGEAYFDVKHDVTRPFIIKTGKADIRVLGTAFNVRNYHDGIFETSLIRGKIEVTLNDRSKKKIILEPSQKIIIADSVFTRNSNLKPDANSLQYYTQIVPVIQKDSSVAEISWLENRLVFYNEPLKEITNELARWFDVKVTFKSNASKNNRYTGIFDNSDLEEIMRILKLSKNIEYSIKDKELIIE